MTSMDELIDKLIQEYLNRITEVKYQINEMERSLKALQQAREPVSTRQDGLGKPKLATGGA